MADAYDRVGAEIAAALHGQNRSVARGRDVQGILGRWLEHPAVDRIVSAAVAGLIGAAYAQFSWLDTPSFVAPDELPGVARSRLVLVQATSASG
jgi:hypothetical protein